MKIGDVWILGQHYGCFRIMMLPPPPPPSDRFRLVCCWWYWLLETAEIVTGIVEVVTDTLHGCWGSWIVSKGIDFCTVIMLFAGAVIEEGVGGCGTGSVGRAVIATPPACCDLWLLIDTVNAADAAAEAGVEEDVAVDANKVHEEEEEVGTNNDFVEPDVDGEHPELDLPIADEVVE